MYVSLNHFHFLENVCKAAQLQQSGSDQVPVSSERFTGDWIPQPWP